MIITRARVTRESFRETKWSKLISMLRRFTYFASRTRGTNEAIESVPRFLSSLYPFNSRERGMSRVIVEPSCNFAWILNTMSISQ